MNTLATALSQHDPATWLTIAVAVALGGMLRGLTGFGAALLMAPLLSLVLTAGETLGLVTVLCALPLGPTLSRRAIRMANPDILLPMVCAATAGIPVGVWLIGMLSPRVFGIVIGASVILSACALLAGLTFPGHSSRTTSIGTGLASGVMTAFGGVGGPPAILYVLGVEPDPYRARANFIVYFACLYPLALIVITVLGVMSWELLIQGVLLAPLFHVGSMVGSRLFTHMNKRLFRPFVLILLLAAGAIAAWPGEVAAAKPAGTHVIGPPSWCEAHCCSAASCQIRMT